MICFSGPRFAWYKKSNGPEIAKRSYGAFYI